jgi:hypothetical protein
MAEPAFRRSHGADQRIADRDQAEQREGDGERRPRADLAEAAGIDIESERRDRQDRQHASGALDDGVLVEIMGLAICRPICSSSPERAPVAEFERVLLGGAPDRRRPNRRQKERNCRDLKKLF